MPLNVRLMNDQSNINFNYLYNRQCFCEPKRLILQYLLQRLEISHRDIDAYWAAPITAEASVPPITLTPVALITGVTTPLVNPAL
jgi:hypothetical protein